MKPVMDYVQRLQIANLQLELDRDAAQVNVVIYTGYVAVFPFDGMADFVKG